MADRKISDLTALTTPASGDYVPIVDISEAAAASKNKRVTIQSLFQGIPVNVGIGTSSPSYIVDIAGTNATTSTLRVSTTATSDASIRTVTSLGSYIFGTGIGTASNCWNVYDANASATRLLIDSSGRVGIGTSSPASILDVAGDVSITGNENYLYLYSTYTVGSNSRVRMRAVGAGGGSGFGGDFRLSTRKSNNTWNTDAFVVDSNGRLGLGVSSPTSLLHLAEAGGITVGTTTGTKIGTATTQKIGFYNATPVVQPTAVADATDAATVITQLNALLTRMRNLGLIAT